MLDLYRRLNLELVELLSKSRVALNIGDRRTYRDGTVYEKTVNGWRRVYSDGEKESKDSSKERPNPQSGGASSSKEKKGSSEKSQPSKSEKEENVEEIAPEKLEIAQKEIGEELKKLLIEIKNASEKKNTWEETMESIKPIIITFVNKIKQIKENAKSE